MSCRTGNRAYDAIGVIAGVLTLLSADFSDARAAELGKEIAIATEHARYAAGSSTIGTVHMHLQHTINCLVGLQGEGYDSKVLNPCAGIGNGAIPDARNQATQAQALQVAPDRRLRQVEGLGGPDCS